MNEDVLIKAYLQLNNESGLAADRICCDAGESIKLIKLYYELMHKPNPFDVPRALMNLRKRGVLPKSKGRECRQKKLL